jgi:GNAT superfamily N-acetyltransferase
MVVTRAHADVEAACERVLRSLPMWFGIEAATLAYVADTSLLPTFVLVDNAVVTGFVTVRQHFRESHEITCIAVHADCRMKGGGARLLAAAEAWSRSEGANFLQVKTLAPAANSAAYEQTRVFYNRMGFVPFEVFETLWSPAHPCLQLVKAIGHGQ